MIIHIPTCGRAEMLHRHVQKLNGATAVFIWINNCDPEPYLQLNWPKWVHLFDETHTKGDPRLCHNVVIREIVKYLYDDVPALILEDDVEPCDDFIDAFKQKVALCEQYSDEFTLSPIWIPEKKCHYTPAYEREIHDKKGLQLSTQRYVDGNWYMTARAIRIAKHALKDGVPVLRSSSGIGPALSKAFFEKSIPMYVCRPSLVGHGDHDSLQFPEGRKKVPLIAKIGV
jgi:hypothetical protein